MVDVIVLAGGKSTRMKQNKMLLLIDGKPIIYWTIKPFLSLVDKVIVVTGKYHEEIKEALKDLPVEIVRNENYELGMFSSVKKGVEVVNHDFMIIPGDCPFVSTETIKKIINGKGDIRFPKYLSKEGHPLYIKYKYKEELLSYPVDSNLKLFRDSHNYEIINVRDKFVVTNLNSFLDYEKIKTERK